MKKITLVLICCTTLFNNAKSQGFYNFQLNTEAYHHLSAADTLIAVSSSTDLYTTNLPKPMEMYGQQTGMDLTIGAKGFIVTTGSQYSFAFDPFLADLIPESGLMLMKWDTLTSNKHLLFEWQNFKLNGHPSSDFVNFTIDFNLQNQVFEFRYGSSQITSANAFQGSNTGPQVITALLSADFSLAYDFNTLHNNPNAPTHHNTVINGSLNAVPDSGTVYRFEPVNISLTETTNSLMVYPNPVIDFLEIEGIANGEIQVIGIEGQKIDTIQFQNGKANLNHLPAGQYLLIIEDSDHEIQNSVKILKK